MKKFWLSGWTKALAFALCLIPLGRLSWRVYVNDLTANPVEFITHFTGDWTLRFLLITLAVTPLRGLLRQPQMIRFRRLVGLFAFFYGLLHLTTWNLEWPEAYGFYANVNPEVDHPTHSQAVEERLGTSRFGERIKTRKFNGYDQAASLYAGMDLHKNY